jgi:sugar/nucleoside kinase (ribokinase family)
LLLYGGEHPRDAGYYASAAAALSIESLGLDGCPSPDDIEKKLSGVY